MDQFNPVAINDTQQAGLNQKAVGPDLMGREQAKQSGAFRQIGKERQVIPFQPTVELPIAYPFQSKQHSQCDNLTGVELRLRMFRQITHRIINSAEQFDDNIFGSHEGAPFADGLVTFSLEDLMTFCN
jgi:hypothetical protein